MPGGEISEFRAWQTALQAPGLLRNQAAAKRMLVRKRSNLRTPKETARKEEDADTAAESLDKQADLRYDLSANHSGKTLGKVRLRLEKKCLTGGTGPSVAAKKELEKEGRT